MVEHTVQPNGFLKGMLWGIALALPIWIVLCILVILALPPHATTVTLGDTVGIPLNGTVP